MSEFLDSFGPKYRVIDEAKNAGQIAKAKETPRNVQEHGVKLFSELAEEGILHEGVRVLDIGSGTGELVIDHLEKLPFIFDIDFIEPSDTQFPSLINRAQNLRKSRVNISKQTADQFLDKIEAQPLEQRPAYDIITLNLSFQYFPHKEKTLKRLLALLNKNNPKACLEIVLTGKEHGQEFVPVYNEAKGLCKEDEVKTLPDWDTGMLHEQGPFISTCKDLGYDCEVTALTDEYRNYPDPNDILYIREKVQSELLYGKLPAALLANFRSRMLDVIRERDVKGETVKVMRLHIKPSQG